jgi:phosphate transport system permease protein
MKSKKNPLETGFHALFLSCGILSVGFVLFITVYLVISGVPAIGQVGIGKFLLGEKWSAGSLDFGILPFILTSVYGTAGAVVLGIPLGILTAVFLAKDAPDWLARLIHTAV